MTEDGLVSGVELRGFLLPAWVSFSLDGKHRVRPFVFLLRRRHSGSNRRRLASPVSRSRLDAPDIPRLFQRDSDQPIVTPGSKGHTVGDARGRTRGARKFIEQN